MQSLFIENAHLKDVKKMCFIYCSVITLQRQLWQNIDYNQPHSFSGAAVSNFYTLKLLMPYLYS